MSSTSYRSCRWVCLATVMTTVAVGTGSAQNREDKVGSRATTVLANGDFQVIVHNQAVIGYILPASRNPGNLQRVFYTRHVGVRQAADGKPWFQVDRGPTGQGDPVVRFTVELPEELPADKVREAKTQLGNAPGVSLVRLPAVQIEVTVECNGQVEVVENVQSDGNLAAVRPINYPITTPALRKQLAANPDAAVVKVQVWSEFQKDIISGVSVTRYSERVADYNERLNTGRRPGQKLILSQEGLRDLRLYLRTTVAAVIDGSVNQERAYKLIDDALKDAAVVLDKGDIDKMAKEHKSERVVLGNDTLRLNLSPDEVRGLKTKFATKETTRKAAEETWNRMAVLVQNNHSHIALSEAVTNEVKTNPTFAATVGFMGFGGKAGGGGGGSTRTEQTYNFTKGEFENVQKQFRDAGESRKSSSRTWRPPGKGRCSSGNCGPTCPTTSMWLTSARWQVRPRSSCSPSCRSGWSGCRTRPSSRPAIRPPTRLIRPSRS